jgi:hypothetical protein
MQSALHEAAYSCQGGVNFDLLLIGMPGTSHDRPVLHQARRQPEVNFHILFKPEYFRLST